MQRRSWITLLVGASACAAALGLGIGYLLWGWPPNWYGRDISKLKPGPDAALVRYGWELVTHTARHIGKNAEDPSKRYAGNDLACINCHLNAGLRPYAAPFVSTFASFPMMVDDRVLTLTDRINGCMQRSMNGRPLPKEGREMQALIEYIKFVGEGSPQGVRVPGMGLRPLREPKEAPSAERGELVYALACARCHGADGQGERKAPPGVGYDIPPLWGDDSFNDAAGMSKLDMAASFIRENMPAGVDYRAPAISDQQAWDVAAFMLAKPRPPGPQGHSSMPPD